MPTAFAPRSNAPAGHVEAPRRSLVQGTRAVVACSLLVTLAAALAALAATAALDVRWSLGFVVARWLLVAVLLVTPVLHQIAVRVGVGHWSMPWALRTPATALLLTVESIAFDILSAHFDR